MKKDALPSGPTPRQDRSNVLPLKGEIDLHVAPSVTALINQVIEEKPERLVVDLSSVTYVDSAGVAALIGAMQRVEGYGGKFLLAGLQETVRSIFEISRLVDRHGRVSQYYQMLKRFVSQKPMPPVKEEPRYPDIDR